MENIEDNTIQNFISNQKKLSDCVRKKIIAFYYQKADRLHSDIWSCDKVVSQWIDCCLQEKQEISYQLADRNQKGSKRNVTTDLQDTHRLQQSLKKLTMFSKNLQRKILPWSDERKELHREKDAISLAYWVKIKAQ